MKLPQKLHHLLPVLALCALGARPATADTVLLDPASVPAAQGWTAFGTSTPAATVTNNGTYTEISTLGTTGGSSGTSGVLLYSKAVSLSSMPTFRIDFSLQVLSGSGVHNLLDGGVVFATGLDNLGTSVQRAQMIYFDPTRIGWADDTASFTLDTTNQFHAYSLSVNTLTGIASLAVDGVTRLTRSGYVTNDKVSFGDQTNDPGLNGNFRIANITLVPEPATWTMLGLGIAAAGVVVLRRRRAV